MTQKHRAASIEGLIDANLKRALGGAVRDELPDRFAEALRRLEARAPDGTCPGPRAGAASDEDTGDDA